MASVKLPVCGDYVDQSLVCAVSARGFRGQPSIVTVWIAGNSPQPEDCYVFQQFEVSTLARAQQVRDQIADLCGLDLNEDDDGVVIGSNESGGGSSEDDGEGSSGEDEEEDSGGVGAAPIIGSSLSPEDALEILQTWTSPSRHSH